MKEGTVYGYARISKPKQSIKRQQDNIKKAYPAAVVISEAYTGTTQARPKWQALKKNLRPGDTVVFDEISRMSRNAAEGFREYKELYSQGVELVFLKEATLNTANYKQVERVAMTGTEVDIILEAVNKYLMVLAENQIKAAFMAAEREIDLLHQRTAEGIQRARLEGKQIGRAPATVLETEKGKRTKEIIKKHCKEYGGTLTDREAMTLAGVSKKTFYKYKKALRNM